MGLSKTLIGTINHFSAQEIRELNSYDPVAETSEYMQLPFYKRPGRKSDFHSFALAKQARAFALWTERVGQNRPWDHKLKIQAKFGDIWHKQGSYDYFYDIWSNIHYGYVGVAGGLSESVLLDGAGIEQIASDSIRHWQDPERFDGPHRTEGVDGMRAWDDAPDRVSIIIGMTLRKEFPDGGVTSKAVMTKVLAVPIANWVKEIQIHVCK